MQELHMRAMTKNPVRFKPGITRQSTQWTPAYKSTKKAYSGLNPLINPIISSYGNFKKLLQNLPYALLPLCITRW